MIQAKFTPKPPTKDQALRLAKNDALYHRYIDGINLIYDELAENVGLLSEVRMSRDTRTKLLNSVLEDHSMGKLRDNLVENHRKAQLFAQSLQTSSADTTVKLGLTQSYLDKMLAIYTSLRQVRYSGIESYKNARGTTTRLHSTNRRTFGSRARKLKSTTAPKGQQLAAKRKLSERAKQMMKDKSD
jgi:hypothetical protein